MTSLCFHFMHWRNGNSASKFLAFGNPDKGVLWGDGGLTICQILEDWMTGKCFAAPTVPVVNFGVWFF